MKLLILTTAMIFSMLTLSSYAADLEHTVSFKGKAEVNVKPDTAYIILYAKADGILMVDAVRKADNLVTEITEAIKSDTNTVKEISQS
jgi:uncharacterized protein YggE